MERISGRIVHKEEKNVFFAGLVSFLTDTTTKMVYSIMPMFLLSIGASKTELSLIEGVAESTASLLKVFSGLWSDRLGKSKPFMFIGYAITAFFSPLFAFATNVYQVLFIRFAERVGKGIRSAPRDSLIACSSENGRTGRSFGLHKAMDNMGAITGPLIAFLILCIFPFAYRKVFLAAFLPAALGLAVIFFFIREVPGKKPNRDEKLTVRGFSAEYYRFLFIVFVFTLGNSTNALLLVKAGEVGIDAMHIPLVYMVFNGVALLFALPAGIISDSLGRERLILAGYLLYAFIYFAFGYTSSKAVIILLFALYGLYGAATDGVQKAMVSDLVEEEKKGAGFGLYNTVTGLTLLPASIIAGFLYDRFGSQVPFYFGAFMALVASFMMYRFLLRQGAEPSPSE